MVSLLGQLNEQEDPNSASSGGGTNSSWTWFYPNVDSNSDVVRVFHMEGTARIVLQNQTSAKQDVTLTNSESLPKWNGQEDGSLQIGESKLYLVDSDKSELMRVHAGSTHFQPVLQIYRLSGEIANSLSDRKTHTAETTSTSRTKTLLSCGSPAKETGDLVSST